jgi:hypothetical protein
MPPYLLPAPTTHTCHICGEDNGIYNEKIFIIHFIPDSIMIAQIGSNHISSMNKIGYTVCMGVCIDVCMYVVWFVIIVKLVHTSASGRWSV